MKKFYILLCFMLASGLGFGQWQQTNVPVGGGIVSIASTNTKIIASSGHSIFL